MSRKQRSALSEKVNQEAATEGSSGWSVRAYGRNRGEKAKDSFMVALPKERVESPISAPVSPQEMSSYQSEHRGLLKQPGMYHGGWIPQTGQGAQDVSTGYPRTEEGLVTAMSAAVQNKQEAIGELGPLGQYVGDIPVPKHLSGQFWPEKMEVKESNNVVSITPSRQEMTEVEAKEIWRQRNQ